MLLKTIKDNVLSLFFPNLCLICKGLSNGSQICKGCKKEFEDLKIKNYCEICGSPLFNEQKVCGDCIEKRPPFRYARSLFLYDGLIKETVFRFKYHGDRLIGLIFVKEMKENLPYIFSCSKYDLILAVPLHPVKLIRRGFNQSQILADGLLDLFGVEKKTNLLVRVIDRGSQIGKSMKEREENVKGAFSVTGTVKNKSILLIDDVYTTGATVSFCAKALKKAGARFVDVYTLARSPHFDGRKKDI